MQRRCPRLGPRPATPPTSDGSRTAPCEALRASAAYARSGPGHLALALDEPAWQRIHGTVQAVHGTTVALKADDGRILTVDTADASKSVGRALTPGERVEVIGQVHRDRNHVTARWIRQDSSSSSRGGRVAGRAAPQPSASPRLDQTDGQRIHGTVQSLRGSTLTLEADDGRVLNVDVTGLSPSLLRALTPGEGVTVIGHVTRDGRQFSAHVIEQDRSGRVARSQPNAPRRGGGPTRTPPSGEAPRHEEGGVRNSFKPIKASRPQNVTEPGSVLRGCVYRPGLSFDGCAVDRSTPPPMPGRRSHALPCPRGAVRGKS